MSKLRKYSADSESKEIDPEAARSDHEEEVNYNHPTLPEGIILKKRTVWVRDNIFEKLDVAQEIKNQKMLRCAEFRKRAPENVYVTFTKNSNKEHLILQHIEKYENQFRIAYNDSRPLLLAPENESGTKKFICTTIRPTKLGYIEFYDFEKCALYISDFITYEPLEDPISLPTIVPSTTSVIEWQRGDCVDISILLCSLLLGVGYEAYCCIGTAPRSITLKNESLMDCPYENMGLELIPAEAKVRGIEEDITYKPEEKKSLTSTYDKNPSEIEKNTLWEESAQAKNILDDDEPDRLPSDPFENRRVHCWVLVMAGARGVKEDYFIEPSTGRTWKVKDNNSPYLTVSQCFSNKNYYINLKNELPVREINFNNMNNGEKDEWEYAMLDTIKFPSLEKNGDVYGEEDHLNVKINPVLDDVQKNIEEIAHLIDMPMPWAPKLFISKDKFIKGSPLGELTKFYEKCRVDFYSKYSQIDGLTKRITFYKDFSRTMVKEIRCIYECRRNNLVMRCRFPYEFKTIEYYQHNNKPLEQNSSWPHWKSIEEVDRQMRIIRFYHNRHDDGLIERREYINQEPAQNAAKRKRQRGKFNKIEEYFEGRDDYLEYRACRYIPQGGKKGEYQEFTSDFLKDSYIVKMTQKFGKNQFMPANNQVMKMTIDLDSEKNRITVFYHLKDGEIAPIFRCYPRAQLTGVLSIPDGSENRIEDPEDQIRQQKILNMEKDCLSGIRNSEKNISKEVTEYRTAVEEKINTFQLTRNYEDALKLIIEKTLHDRAREKSKQALNKGEDEDETEINENDILAPFWDEKIPINKVLDRAEATRIKNDVLSKFKERIISRADIIDKRIKKETELLDKMMKDHERRAGDNEKKDDINYAEKIINHQARVNILESRAARFEIKAAAQFKELQKTLLNDPRLAALKTKE